MSDMQPIIRTHFNPGWCEQVFEAKAVAKGGIVRRQIVDVERQVGRAYVYHQLEKRGFHLVECGTQFIVICNGSALRVHV